MCAPPQGGEGHRFSVYAVLRCCCGSGRGPRRTPNVVFSLTQQIEGGFSYENNRYAHKLTPPLTAAAPR